MFPLRVFCLVEFFTSSGFLFNWVLCFFYEFFTSLSFVLFHWVCISLSSLPLFEFFIWFSSVLLPQVFSFIEFCTCSSVLLHWVLRFFFKFSVSLSSALLRVFYLIELCNSSSSFFFIEDCTSSSFLFDWVLRFFFFDFCIWLSFVFLRVFYLIEFCTSSSFLFYWVLYFFDLFI